MCIFIQKFINSSLKIKIFLKLLFLQDFFFVIIVVLSYGTLWQLEKFLQCIIYIILKFTPSTILILSVKSRVPSFFLIHKFKPLEISLNSFPFTLMWSYAIRSDSKLIFDMLVTSLISTPFIIITSYLDKVSYLYYLISHLFFLPSIKPSTPAYYHQIFPKVFSSGFFAWSKQN
jgi:hypothetical protein